jgi:hypothetical protein
MVPATRSSGWLAWRYWPVAILIAGAAFRLIWAIVTLQGSRAEGEIANVAIAFAKTGVLADAFQPGQGPTAHVLPLPPVYAGLIYRTFGIHSATSELLLAAVAIALVTTSFGLLYLAFGRIGTPRLWRLMAIAFLSFAPLNFHLEIEAFRIWEGALSVALASGFLLALLDTSLVDEVSWVRLATMSMFAALLFWISPPLGLGAYVCSLLLLIEKLPARRWPAACALATASLAVFIVPWAIRNARVMGEPVLLRSNFGLELALANHPAAAGPGDAAQIFRERLAAIHPFQSKAAYAKLQQAGGEIAYARGLGDEAKAWIADHPGDFLRLCATHLRDFFLPPAWLWNIYSDIGPSARLKAAVHAALSILGLAGALAASLASWRRYRFAVIMMLVPLLPYVVTQPVLRYRYIIYGLSVFFAMDLMARLSAVFGRRSARGREMLQIDKPLQFAPAARNGIED